MTPNPDITGTPLFDV